MEMLKRLWNDEEGQGLVEYALIIVLISIVAITVMSFVGVDITNVFKEISDTIS